MPLDPTTTPNGEIVKAFALAHGNEAGKLVLAYLSQLVERIKNDETDDTGRIDPLKLAKGRMADWLLTHIKSIPELPKSPDWQKLERQRELLAAQQRLEGAKHG